MGTSAEDDVQEAIADLIRRDPEIHGLFNSITQQMGPQVMLAAKIRMRPGISIEARGGEHQCPRAAHQGALPGSGWCFIRPDLED